MKKAVSVLLILVFVLSVITVTASAAEDSYSTVYEAIYNGLLDGDTSINLSAYMISSDELHVIISDIKNNEPLFFYVANGYSWSNYSGGVYCYYPKYLYAGTELESAKSFVDTKLNAIIATVPASLDDYQKALYLHDYICVNYGYDMDYGIYDLYGMLQNGEGVCQAYSYLYDALLSMVGIDSRAVISDELNHMWNEIRLGGKWYHVDVTWDDAVDMSYNDVFARAKHEYFLLSDSASSSAHDGTTDMVVDIPCDDTSLDDLSWHSADIPFAFVGGDTYYVNGGSIKKIDLKTGVSSSVYTIDVTWSLSNGAYYSGCYSGLGSFGNKLIFNTDKKIMCFDPETETVTEVYDPQIGTDNIYRMIVSGDTVYYMTSEKHSYTGTVSSYKLNLSDFGIEQEPVILRGDVNGDGYVKSSDYLLLKRYMVGKYTLDDEGFKRADVNNDGYIKTSDYILIKRALLGEYVIQ